MLLGDLIAKFDDPDFAGEALFALDDLVLTAQVTAAAAAENISPGEFAMQAVGQFVNHAKDEQWLGLVGVMAKSDNPGQVFLRRVLASGLASGIAGSVAA